MKLGPLKVRPESVIMILPSRLDPPSDAISRDLICHRPCGFVHSSFVTAPVGVILRMVLLPVSLSMTVPVALGTFALFLVTAGLARWLAARGLPGEPPAPDATTG